VAVNAAALETCTPQSCYTCPLGTSDLFGTGMDAVNGAGTGWLTAIAPVIARPESGPHELPTETNVDRRLVQALKSQSLVQSQHGSTAKTPRNRGDFSGCAGLETESLRTRGLDGGGGSLERTCLCCRFPDLQGKYREILRNWILLADPAPRFPSLSVVIATDSL
jgi:hypothetical protein